MTGSGDSGAPRPRRRPRARRGEGGRLYEELLDAAEDLLDTSGEDAVTIRAVARRVGVSNPAVYLHFADRSALLSTVCLRVWDRLDAYMADAGSAATDPVTDLRNRCVAYIRFGLDHPLRYRLVASGPATEATAQVADACFRNLRQAVRRTAGDDGVPDSEVTALTRAVCACLHGAVSLLLLQSASVWPDDLDRYADDVASLATSGVLHRMGRRPAASA
ncbi:AcrR family transcriptional regulator [Streptomyces sp. B3I7]|uniref:TetR/AcrR family transcriptional regulator n=1 Tax=Streptomyces sp. B3I7 TaxID=3042269 RepID=UPI0027867BF6|nr:TetR/AcrR family transcriptional regulator [Streptomyces sp. B3I7]MDQ0808839.1 AcrR family transcriptional regulator [Streptomyces sp. B3I7]